MTVPMWQVCSDLLPMHLPGERDLHELHRPGLPQDRPDLDDLGAGVPRQQAAGGHMSARIALNGGRFALVDECDVPLVREYKWRLVRGSKRQDDGLWYAIASWGSWRPDIKMHTLITGWGLTDHINGDGLDNRRCNLRQATRSQNMWNRRKHRGRSRYKGVTWHGQRLRWQARIKLAGREKSLGLYGREIDAALAYDAAARALFGDFAALNFPGPGERSALTRGQGDD